MYCLLSLQGKFRSDWQNLADIGCSIQPIIAVTREVVIFPPGILQWSHRYIENVGCSEFFRLNFVCSMVVMIFKEIFLAYILAKLAIVICSI